MDSATRLFELRTYHAAPGKLDALLARFRDHTLALFAKHGLTVAGFWVALDDADQPAGTVVYLLAFADRDAADRAWAAFRHDPTWLSVRAATEEDGPLTTAIESTFLSPTAFSPII